MEVIILAGGLGTRLRSAIGNEIPKCMAPVAGKPFLWYILKYLTRYDVSHVILSVGYLHDIIIDWIDGNGAEFPFSFDYAIEIRPLGTGGGIKLALGQTYGNDIIVLNGDTFFDIDLNKLLKDHFTNDRPAITLALKPMTCFDRYGNVQMRTDNKTIAAFEEKQYCADGLINGGVYIINKDKCVLDRFHGNFSFEKEILEHSCQLGYLHGIVQNDYFIDIGIPADYEKANREFPNLLF